MTSTRVVQSVAMVGMLLAGTRASGAQTCLGLPSLGTVARSVSLTGSGNGSDRLLLGRFGMARQHTFAGVHAGYGGSNDLWDAKNLALGIDLGVAVPVRSTGIEMCPMLRSIYQRGPERDGLRLQSVVSTAGLSFGRAFKFTPAVSMVPFIQGSLLHNYVRYGDSYVPQLADGNGPDRFGAEFSAGVGLRLNDLLTIRPAASLIRGVRGGDLGMSLTASFGLHR